MVASSLLLVKEGEKSTALWLKLHDFRSKRTGRLFIDKAIQYERIRARNGLHSYHTFLHIHSSRSPPFPAENHLFVRIKCASSRRRSPRPSTAPTANTTPIKTPRKACLRLTKHVKEGEQQMFDAFISNPHQIESRRGNLMDFPLSTSLAFNLALPGKKCPPRRPFWRLLRSSSSDRPFCRWTPTSIHSPGKGSPRGTRGKARTSRRSRTTTLATPATARFRRFESTSRC